MGRRRATVILLLILIIQYSPTAFASSDGIVINLSQTSVDGDGEVGPGPVGVELNLTAVSGTAQQVTWNVSLSSLEGDLIDFAEGISTLSSGEFETIDVTLSTAPLGHSILNISLAGNLGTLGAQQAHYLQLQIQRLRPLDVGLGSTSQWLIDAVDSNSNPTGNSSLRQGDGANVSIPVVNDGDVNWSGGISAELDGQSVLASSLDVSADSSKVVVLHLPAPLQEGEHTLWVNLSGVSDSDSSDESTSLEFSVGPPPLAEFELTLLRGELASAGERQHWNLSINNVGEVAWSGQLTCTFATSTLHEQDVTVVSQLFVSLSTTARPGTLTCQLSGARVHASSQMSVQDILNIPAASFVASGDSQPALSGGPWHIDDRITASLLVRNNGDEEGSVSLELQLGAETSTSSAITLGPGDAKELSHSIVPQLAGTSQLVWNVVSTDGAVDSELSGEIEMIVSTGQELSVSITSFSEDLDWTFALSEGVDRDVELSAGWIVDGSETMLYHSQRTLSPGLYSMSADIGVHNSAEGVFVRISPLGWTNGGGQLQSSLAITETSSQGVISLDPLTTPRPPVAGESASVEVILKNTGDAETGLGEVIIFDGVGTILTSFETTSLTPQQELRKSVDITWPEGTSVSLNARWFVDDLAISTSQSYSVPSSDQAQQLDLPWMSMLTGLGIAAAIIFVLRLFRESEDDEEEDKPIKKSETDDSKEVEKVEINCPECERSLRVPASHTGKVRCPECSTSFSAQQKDSVMPEPVIEEEEELTSSSSTDNLPCPKCTRTLRVPVERRPAKARCPACETIFRALKE